MDSGQIPEMVNLGKRTEIADTTNAKRIQQMEEKFSGIVDTVEEINISVHESVKPKKSAGTIHPGNMRCYEKV